MSKDNKIPPSLQPRKKTKKAVHKSVETSAPVEKKETSKMEKKRFTLWVSEDVYKAFKIHTATAKGGASKYIEDLIRRDLNID